ncbi:MAG: PIG-L family deacetylase [Acidimicrobiales bacterium]
MSRPLTFLAVHAHPDDEASSTGGVYRLYADQGIRTVLITCTNGECGDGPGGVKPGHPEHDPEQVSRVRAGELERAVAVLGVDRLVRLGYRDSGMMGWPQNDDPRSLWSAPVERVAAQLVDVLVEERPQVVVTYNERGFYGHPDHVAAHRATMAAVSQIDDPPTVYFNAIPDSVMAVYRRRWAEEDRRRREAAGEEAGQDADLAVEDPAEEFDLGTPDDQIDAVVDVRAVADAHFDALAAHASQMRDSFWMTMGRERFREEMTTEWFVRATNPRGLRGVVDDLFVGYR